MFRKEENLYSKAPKAANISLVNSFSDTTGPNIRTKVQDKIAHEGNQKKNEMLSSYWIFTLNKNEIFYFNHKPADADQSSEFQRYVDHIR